MWIMAFVIGAVGSGLFLLFRRYIGGRACSSQVTLEGKTVIITGANTGIGLETAVDLAKRKARVILACRSLERGERAAVEVRQRSGNDNVVFVQLDLASLESVREFAAKILKDEPQIDILINNAGVSCLEGSLTVDGYEKHMGINHLSHFLLTHLLLDRLKEAPQGRIVNVSAAVYKFFDSFDFENINSIDESRYSTNIVKNAGYAHSKMAQILSTRALARRLKGTNVTVNVLHPGVINTELGRETWAKIPRPLVVSQITFTSGYDRL